MTTYTSTQNKRIRSGYTTGTSAAAAAHAALELLVNNNKLSNVEVNLPQGGTINIPIKNVTLEDGKATAEVIKDAGDDPDVTNGISIFATVELLAKNEIIIVGGKGVGRVTKPGLSTPVGASAINPVPMKMIKNEINKILPIGKGVKVLVSAPEGERLAAKTLNPRLGIVGGISILGTTGIVRPMSEEAYVDSLIPQINQAMALGHEVLVLTPGGMGANKAAQMGVPEDAVVQTSNFIGIMLEECAKRNVKGILLFGHIGKLIKVAAGIFHTHSKVADGRRETLAAHAAMLGAPKEIIHEIMELNTIDASINLIKEHKLEDVYHSIALWASKRSMELIGENIKIGTMMYSLAGEIIGYDQNALELGRKLGWQVKL